VDEVHKLQVNQEVLVVEVVQQLQVDPEHVAKVNQVEQLVPDLTLLVVEVELRKQVLQVQVLHQVQELVVQVEMEHQI
jgi:hypothetical protein